MEKFTEISVDKAAKTIKFGAGVTYTKLIEALVKE